MQYSASGSGDEINAGNSFSLFSCCLAPCGICLLRFLLEGYDGLTTLTTISVADGLVCCLVPEGQEAEMCQLLENLCVEGLIYSFAPINFSELKRYPFNEI